jgi:hypothetical protein
MAMVLHELATNAAKYGALSTKEGRVSIRWHRWNGRQQTSLVLEWQEVGGPPVVATGKTSYGTSTICDLIPYEFGGTVELVLAPNGVRCHLELPADWLIGVSEKRIRQNGVTLPTQVPKSPSLEFREHIKRALRAVDSHIAKGAQRLFEQEMLIAKHKDRQDLTIALELKFKLETGLHLLRLNRARLLKELEQD